jgi:hypothetical protein
MKWQAKLSSKLFNVPYSHTTFTLPKELRLLCKKNQRLIYDLLFHSAWKSINKLVKDPVNVGGQVGMISVLHTWGSDLKYHVHIHCLITFGGLDSKNNWVWPKHKKRLASYDKINKAYRKAFIKGLAKLVKQDKLDYHQDILKLIESIKQKRWVVNHAWPSRNTEVIEGYLAKYINRSAVTPKRLKYDSEKQTVYLSHKDYRQQKTGKAAPYIIKPLNPLTAIHQILQHKLPVGYQRIHYYGLHSSQKEKQIKDKINPALKRDTSSIKILFSLLNQMLKLTADKKKCAYCGQDDFAEEIVSSSRSWPSKNIRGYGKNKAPPQKIQRQY